jgi:hypothetical protein
MPRIQLQPSLLERLDCFFFFFFALLLGLSFPNTWAFPLAMPRSHHMCHHHSNQYPYKAVVFRIENNWMEHEDYLPTVEKIWTESIFDGDAAKRISAKFKILRKRSLLDATRIIF